MAPYYNKPPQEGLYQHFRAIAEAVNIPVMLYNIPSRTGVNIEPETIARLSEIPNIVALKEAGGSTDQISRIKALVSPDFYLYSGDDIMTLPLLALGGVGVVSVASHLVGKEIKKMIQLFDEGKTKEALKVHLELYPLFKALFISTNPIPVKAALNLAGWRVGGVRPPLSSLEQEKEEKLKSVLEKFHLI